MRYELCKECTLHNVKIILWPHRVCCPSCDIYDRVVTHSCKTIILCYCHLEMLHVQNRKENFLSWGENQKCVSDNKIHHSRLKALSQSEIENVSSFLLLM